MDDRTTRTGDALYDLDFYASTQEQARLLRSGQVQAADLSNIAEELETLGRKEATELRSRCRVLLQHLLKQSFRPNKRGRSWTTTILHQRIEIAGLIEDNPSLKSRADVLFARAYDEARVLAAAQTGLALTTFPELPPFTRGEAAEWTDFPDVDAPPVLQTLA